MKLLIAYVKPFKVAEVTAALEEIGIRRLSVTEAKGYGRQRGHSEFYKGAEYQVDFVPKSRLEIALDADDVEPAVQAILKAAQTGTMGDGKIFVVNLDEAVRIRTGDRGPDAL
jgi:nitrogen regulatory protein PII